MAGILTLQVAITGTAQQLPSNPVPGSCTIAAAAGNTADIVISTSATDGAAGFLLSKGVAVSLPSIGNTNTLFVNGTSADKFSLIASL